MEVCAFTSGVLRDYIVEIIFLKTSNILSLGSLSKILRAQMLQNKFAFLDVISLLSVGACDHTNTQV